MFLFSVEKGAPSVLYRDIYFNEVRSSLKCTPPPKKLRTRLTALTVSRFFGILLNKTIANTYFFAPLYFSGQLIHCLEISGNKSKYSM